MVAGRRRAPSLGGAGAASRSQPQWGARREAALDKARGGAGELHPAIQGGRERLQREQEQARSSRSQE